MRRFGYRPIIFFLFSVGFLWLSSSIAQDQPAHQGAPTKAPSKKQIKQREKKSLDEMGSHYNRWLNEDAIYIITPEERAAFLRLSTNEEREQAIEAFWQRRSSDPDSLENTFKEEHYRRIAYANEHFASGIPGWKTDRGHMYILWGPPDEIESHPTGCTYDRPPEEGGGSTSTYPWEKWRYRHLEGVRENVELEFVDPSGSGEYHLTRDPSEKDALARVPGAGLSESELLGLSTKASRFTNTNGTFLPRPLAGLSASMDEFDSLDLFFRVQHPPTRFKDLEAQVSARIVASQIHMDYRFDFLRVTSDTVLVPITVRIANRELSFQSKQGVHSAVLNLYARITTPGGRMVQTFEDIISRDFSESLFQPSLNLSSIYQKAVPLRRGLYRLDIVTKDVHSGNVGVVETALRVPRYEDDKLDASSLILADQLEPVSTRQASLGQFVLGSYKVRPRVNQEFSTTDKMGVFLQLYNLKLDDSSHKTSVSVTYRITRDHQEIWKAAETSDQLHQAGDQVTLQRNVPVASLSPGRYTIEIRATDQLSNQTISRTADFTIKPAPGANSARIPLA